MDTKKLKKVSERWITRISRRRGKPGAYCFAFLRFLHTFRPSGAYGIGDNDFYKHSVPTGLKNMDQAFLL